MNISVMNSKDNWNIFSKNRNAIYGVAIISIMIFHFFEDIANSNWTKSLRDGLPRLWHSDFLFSITKQWKASPKSSIVKSPQRNNQTGSTFPLPMKRIPPFRLVGKRFYDPNAPPYKAVFWITTDFIWRILLCMKNI